MLPRAAALAHRVDAATPPGRDRTVDALRALAVLGVVIGHWLVTALVADTGTVHGTSPLVTMPQLAAISWVFQTLSVFFLVGGYVAAKGYAVACAKGVRYRDWAAARMLRLFRPVAALLATWACVCVAMLAAGVRVDTVTTLLKLVLSPLWFLLVFAALTAATPLVAKLHPLWPLAVVLHVDLIRFGLGGPEALGLLTIGAGWLVPYCLGALWARGGLRPRTTGLVLLPCGVLATAALVLFAGYPASMVGVPGAAVSNLNPPTLAAVCFGLAQCGAALLLLEPLRRLLRRPLAWAGVALLNLSVMTVFLWHQTAMIAVTALGLLAGRPLAGLHTAPEGPGWVLARIGWLPVFACALLVCWAAYRTYEQRRIGGGRVVQQGAPGRTSVEHRA
ncbi:acyltransferase [Streptomyces sp. NBC_00237]|uniref:acyltransferase family protein n=1 Tax=Streptomyces sp. NBC_00237 TaxID=2975687 RepID=UPI00225B1AFF|nr:acyltransferase [Streptomyces sp. NBC_00237]MCX5203323.1 acyltransferase [Streptomyces sp. NBC_00237]